MTTSLTDTYIIPEREEIDTDNDFVIELMDLTYSPDKPTIERVSLARYREDIRHYLKKEAVYRAYRVCMEIILAISVCIALLAGAAMDSEGPILKVILFIMFASVLVCALCGFALRIPGPKLPKGVGRKKEGFVITDGRYHKGYVMVLKNKTIIK